jgi:eukaryotic-like serine/threonine-protein kinase
MRHLIGTAMTPARWRQIEELYHSAREREPGARSALLAQACGDDEELRRRVERLLAQDDSGDKILDRPATDLLLDPTVTQVAAGVQLGPYRIEGTLGAGGMGEVFRAVDTRLGRTVAIKVVNQQFSQRFEREARAISALNHPHICTVHDVGPDYLVMELVEGGTLAARIKKGALPIGEVLRYGAQIADALAEAHSKGITHRDLKPANVMIARNGVKVLDFGLAKFSETGSTLTQSGAAMGTPAYMAPEQMAGKEADARTDIYALGLTLYEMATGKQIMPGQPLAMDGLPPQFAHVVERCLAREAENRWQTASDVKAELEWTAKVQPASAAAAVRSNRRWRHALAALGVVTIAAAWSVWHFRQGPTDERVLRLQIEPPSGGNFATGGNTGVGGMALSPDGRTAAFVATVGEQTGLWVRPLDGAPRLLFPATGGAVGHPFWSPDGQSIVYSTLGKVQRINLAGGAPVILWEGPETHGGVWLPSGRMVLSGDRSGLMQAPSPGGTLTRLTELDASSQEVQHVFPQALPGDRLLYLAESGVPGNSAIYAISLAKPSERVRVLSTNTNALYASGYLLWWNGGSLVAQKFDPATFKLGEEPHSLAEGVALQEGRKMNVAVSANGYLLYDPSALRRQLQWFDSSGKTLGPAGDRTDVGMFRLSSDGRRIAFVTGNQNVDNAVWVVDEHGLASRVTSQPAAFNSPIWSPDGQHMVVTIRSPEFNLFRMDANGSGGPLRLTRSPNNFATDWSRDGRSILFWESTPATKIDLWVLPVTPQGVPDGKPRPYLRTPSIEAWGRFSPEASPRWVAYQSNESGRVEVYIRAFPEAGRPFRISPGGGSFPAWGPDGRELYYETLESKLAVASLKFGAGSVQVSAPRELFDLPPSGSGSGAPPFDISPDGKRFLVRVETRRDSGLTLVTNWPALIRTGSAAR